MVPSSDIHDEVCIRLYDRIVLRLHTANAIASCMSLLYNSDTAA